MCRGRRRKKRIGRVEIRRREMRILPTFYGRRIV
jgi:hypothetical protein